MYLYHTTLFKDLTDVFGAAASNDDDVVDFEGPNKKADALEVTDITIEETTFELQKTYAEFDAIIDGTNFTWADVRYIDDGQRYTLYLTSSNPA